MGFTMAVQLLLDRRAFFRLDVGPSHLFAFTHATRHHPSNGSMAVEATVFTQHRLHSARLPLAVLLRRRPSITDTKPQNLITGVLIAMQSRCVSPRSIVRSFSLGLGSRVTKRSCSERSGRSLARCKSIRRPSVWTAIVASLDQKTVMPGGEKAARIPFGIDICCERPLSYIAQSSTESQCKTYRASHPHC